MLSRQTAVHAMAADYIAAGCRYNDAEMARVAALPVGAERNAATRNGKG